MSSKQTANLSNSDVHALGLRSGFTFIEVMIALAVISGLLVAVITTMNHHMGILERQRKETISTLLAKEKLFLLKKTMRAEKGLFPEPYSAWGFETEIKDSEYPGLLELSSKVTNGKEQTVLSELVQKQ